LIQLRADLVHGADSQGGVQAAEASADAQYAVAQLALFQRKPDRRSDQSDSDNTNAVKQYRLSLRFPANSYPVRQFYLTRKERPTDDTAPSPQIASFD
jgi:hypothetical protein